MPPKQYIITFVDGQIRASSDWSDRIVPLARKLHNAGIAIIVSEVEYHDLVFNDWYESKEGESK